MNYLRLLVSAFIVFMPFMNKVCAETSQAVIYFPLKAHVKIVSDSINVNGLAMNIWEFTSQDNVNEVLDFYKRLWAESPNDALPGYIENELGEWLLISRATEGSLISVLLKSMPMNTSKGLVSVSKYGSRKSKPKLGRNFATLHGSDVIVDFQSDDLGKKSSTVIVENTHSTGANYDFYRSHYLGGGWRLLGTRLPLGSKGEALILKKGKKEIRIAIEKDRKVTRIVAVMMETN